MSDKLELVYFPKQKYFEQIVAVKLAGGGNMRLFDACALFMHEETWHERERVFEESGKFAERFVAQMNSEGEKS